MVHHATRMPWDGKIAPYAAIAHALVLIGFLSWRFGGMEPFSRNVAGQIVAVAPLVTILAWREADRSVRHHFVRIAGPLLALAVIVLGSALNPYMRLLTANGEPLGLVDRPEYVHALPSMAWPAQGVPDFLLNAGLVLVGLNLFLARPTRDQQRVLLWAVALDAAALAAIGSFFKLTHASQIFGIYPSPNPNFFASFFYYNHWGAFALLGVAAAGALALYYKQSENDWLHSPAPLLGVLVLILLLSLPLAGGRASILAGLFLALVFLYRLIPRRGDPALRRRGLAAATIALALLVGGTGWLARGRLDFLFKKTTHQVGTLQAGGMGDARLAIYRETWQLFLARPLYGWGWQGFRRAVFRPIQKFDFRMQNEQKQNTVVLDAHNDWLQFLAELGLVGAVLGIATCVGFARVAARKRWMLAPSFELVAGVASVGLLACLDFPFACPAVVVTAWTLLATAAAIARDREKSSTAPA